MRAFWKTSLKIVLWVGGLLLVVAGVMRLFFIDLVEVGHDAMAPTMIAGEKIMMWRGADDPQMGQIVVCRHPRNEGQMVIGRVMGRGGMSVKDVRGILEISGTRPDRDVLDELRFFDHTLSPAREATYRLSLEKLGNSTFRVIERDRFTLRIRETAVPDGHVYLLADNRAAVELDSRAFGTVPAANCIGRMFMRLSPSEGRSAGLGNGWFDFLDP